MGREAWRKAQGVQGAKPGQPEGLGSLSRTEGFTVLTPRPSQRSRLPACSAPTPTLPREPRVTGMRGTLEPQSDALVGRGWPWRSARAFPEPSGTISPGPVPPAPEGGRLPGVERGRERQAAGPLGLRGKELTSRGVTLLLYQNRALEQTLVKMPVPWAGLAPCPLPQQTAEPAYPTSPAFPPLSCPFASRVVYQDGFYGAEIYVSVAPGEGRVQSRPQLPPGSGQRSASSPPLSHSPHPTPRLGTQVGEAPPPPLCLPRESCPQDFTQPDLGVRAHGRSIMGRPHLTRHCMIGRWAGLSEQGSPVRDHIGVTE